MTPGGRVLKSLAKILKIQIAPHHLDILQGPVSHQIRQEADRVRQSLFGRFEPDHAWRHVQQIGIVR